MGKSSQYEGQSWLAKTSSLQRWHFHCWPERKGIEENIVYPFGAIVLQSDKFNSLFNYAYKFHSKAPSVGHLESNFLCNLFCQVDFNPGPFSIFPHGVHRIRHKTIYCHKVGLSFQRMRTQCPGAMQRQNRSMVTYCVD